MSDETIMLAKNLDRAKLTYPVHITEKLDGVPAHFYVPEKSNSGKVLVETRQGEPLYSVEHIQDWLTGILPKGSHLVCELYIPKTPFKDISGKVRSHDPQPDLFAYVFDYIPYLGDNEPGMDGTDLTYKERMEMFAKLFGKHISPKNDWMVPVRIIPGKTAESEDELDEMIDAVLHNKPDAEGVILRPMVGKDSGYHPGKRSWGFQRLKGEDTLDLRVVGFEEAKDKNKRPKGMVGRIQIEYKGEVTGAGPGKLTHAERIYIWQNQKKFIGKIAEIACKPDPSYDKLREGRFIRWRDDKKKSDS